MPDQAIEAEQAADAMQSATEPIEEHSEAQGNFRKYLEDQLNGEESEPSAEPAPPPAAQPEVYSIQGLGDFTAEQLREMKRLAEGYKSMQADYTQKTQALSAREKEYLSYLSQVRQALQLEQQRRAEEEQRQRQQPPAQKPEPEPDEMAEPWETQGRALRKEIERLEALIEEQVKPGRVAAEELQALRKEAEKQAWVNKYTADFDALEKEFPHVDRRTVVAYMTLNPELDPRAVYDHLEASTIESYRQWQQSGTGQPPIPSQQPSNQRGPSLRPPRQGASPAPPQQKARDLSEAGDILLWQLERAEKEAG